MTTTDDQKPMDTTEADSAAGVSCAAASGSQLVTVSDAIKWAMDLCREARDNAENLSRYYTRGKKHKALAEESRMKAANANVAIAHLERVLAENVSDQIREE
jgi:hypothetical protein